MDTTPGGLGPQPMNMMTQGFHLVRNLYMSFALSLSDFEHLKHDTLRLISQNPALTKLLKPNLSKSGSNKSSKSSNSNRLNQSQAQSATNTKGKDLSLHKINPNSKTQKVIGKNN